MRLVASPEQRFDGRVHFFACAAEAMRRILIERARRVSRVKRGGDQKRTELSDQVASGDEPDTGELLAVDQALTRLEERDPQMAQVVKLRYFAGLSVKETAEALGIAPRSVNRHWTAARAWLNRELKSAG